MATLRDQGDALKGWVPNLRPAAEQGLKHSACHGMERVPVISDACGTKSVPQGSQLQLLPLSPDESCALPSCPEEGRGAHPGRSDAAPARDASRSALGEGDARGAATLVRVAAVTAAQLLLGTRVCTSNVREDLLAKRAGIRGASGDRCSPGA